MARIICPECMATNRLPAEKSIYDAKCGKCKNPFAQNGPIELNDHNFNRFIAKTSLPIIVDFWAPWCGPCKMMAPEFEKAMREISGKAVFAKLNTQQNQQIAAQNKIQGIPALIIFKNGQPAAHLAGLRQADEIIAWVNNCLSK